MELTYFGHSAFQIETDGTTLLFDPFIDGNKHAEEVVDAGDLEPDAVLLTHAHGDHWGNAPDILRRTGARAVANYEIVQYVQSEVGHENAHPMNTGGSWTFDWGEVTMTYARHSSSFPDGTYGGNPNGFILEIEGKTVYNTGDTCRFAEMEYYGDRYDFDLVLLPIGDDFTMGPEEAAECAELLQSELTVPLHYDTFPYIEVDTDDWLDAMVGRGLTAQVVDPGETLVL